MNFLSIKKRLLKNLHLNYGKVIIHTDKIIMTILLAVSQMQ